MMPKLVAGLFCVILICGYVKAQRKTVLLEPQNRKINQGDPLPPQASFDIQIPVNRQTGIIKINIIKGSNTKEVIQRTFWVRPVNFTGEFAELPVDVRLRNNSKYGFDVTIYSILSDSEKVTLTQILHQNIINYLNANVEATSNRMDVASNAAKMVQDLNALVKRSLTYYRNTSQRDFEGFSDVVRAKLQQVEKARLNDAQYNVIKGAADSLQTVNEMKAAYANKLTVELEQIILNEVDNYLSLDFVKLYDSFVIGNRVTERSQTVLPLFIGFGGVYLSGDLNDLEYDSQPYAGFSFPLGKGTETHFGRTSFIMGVFLSNFKDGKGKTITGPVIDRPIFAGLGLRLYDFINLNAGLVATSIEKQTISNIKTEDVKLKPFIGLNAQFNLWLGLNKK
ncbi:MAG: hypothetical protein WKF97_24745 [Chitinophagaceae bacterium]